MQHPSPRSNYRTDIDGLRAVAVLSVVLYHIGMPHFPGGYVGVDIFFVISGYLITRIVYTEACAGRFSFARFYERRARRLLPALFVMIAAGFVAAWFVSSPYDLDQYGLSATAALFFVANFHFKDAIDYFNPDAEYHPLLHTWSLAVEEQFYLIFPVLLILALRFNRVALVVGAVAAISLAASVQFTKVDPDIAFYLVPFRAWELMAGAAIALGFTPALESRPAREAVAAAGLLMIAIAVGVFDDQTAFPGVAALLPAIGAALIIHAGGGGETLVGRGLSLRPMVFVGLISYSLYLWHWPILAFLRLYQASTEITPTQALPVLVLSMIVAALSWRYVEQPFRRPGKLRRAQVFGWSAAGAAALGLVGLAAHLTEGAPARTSPEYRLLAAGAQDVEPERFDCVARMPERPPCRIGPAGAPADLLLLGDSHAASIVGALRWAENGQGRAFWLAAHVACPPALGITVVGASREATCATHTEAVIRWLESGEGGVKRVLLAARWAFYFSGILSERNADKPFPLILEESPQPNRPDPAANAGLLRSGLERTLERLRAAGIEVYVLGAIPEIGWNVPRKLAVANWRGAAPPQAPDLSAYDRRNGGANALLRSLSNRYDAHFVPVGQLFCQPECALARLGRPLYVDADHLSSFGARLILGPLLASAIER